MRIAAVVVVPVFLLASHGRAQCSASTDRLVKDGRYDEARAEAETRVRAKASDDAALHCLGVIALTRDKSSEAVDWLEKAVKANDSSALHHLYLGQALGAEAMKASKFRQPFLAKRVKTEFERTVALDPDLLDGHEGLMQFYLQAPGFMGGGLEKAKEQARAIAHLNSLQGHYAMANIALHEKDNDAAEREMRAAITEAPDSLDVWYALGSLYQNEKRWADAFALYDKVIAARSGAQLAHFFYGRAAAISGQNLERGERELKWWLGAAAKDAPVTTRSGAHVRLGMIYEKQGQRDAARAEYEAALAIIPGNTDARKLRDALR